MLDHPPNLRARFAAAEMPERETCSARGPLPSSGKPLGRHLLGAFLQLHRAISANPDLRAIRPAQLLQIENTFSFFRLSMRRFYNSTPQGQAKGG